MICFRISAVIGASAVIYLFNYIRVGTHIYPTLRSTQREKTVHGVRDIEWTYKKKSIQTPHLP